MKIPSLPGRISLLTAVSAVSDALAIQSHRGEYVVHFRTGIDPQLGNLLDGSVHPIIDANVARLYCDSLRPAITHENAIIIEATESNKSIQNVIPVFEQLVAHKVRRDHTLVAIGGGIVQDICCFVASTLLRGLSWRYVPTTLLAQADSCIGSKSSINLGPIKNIIGTFNPPKDVFIQSAFLRTLEPKEIRSGIGEILKVHVIDGRKSFDRLARDFDALTTDWDLLQRYIRASLEIKKGYIEKDEFDRGVRNVFNYGHSFGHAIESATDYGVPHGIAVSIGMDMANFVAARRGILPAGHFDRMHPVLSRNYQEYADTKIPIEGMLLAMTRDKKNSGQTLGLILAAGDDASVKRMQVPMDANFKTQCREFLGEMAA